MTTSYKILFSYLLLLGSVNLKAQKIFFEQITTAEGLPSDYVNCVFEDKKGFLWIGTDKGAGRYDGRRFQYFNNDNGLSSNFVSCFEEDPAGNIWIGTINTGLCKYDGKKITQFMKLENKAQHIFKIHFNHDSSFFIVAGGAGFKHLYYFKNEFSSPKKFENMAFLKMLSPEVFITGSVQQLYKLELKNKNIFFHPLQKPDVINADVLYWLGDHRFVAVKKHSVLEYITDGQRWFLHKEFPVYKFTLYPEWGVIKNLFINGNELLMATSNGLTYIDVDSKEHFFNAENGLGSNYINYLYKDKRNNIYVCTYGGGIKIWPKKYLAEYKTNGKVTSIFHAGNTSFIATTKAVYRFNSSLESLDEFKNFSSGSFTSIYQVPQGDLYIGTLNNFYKLSARSLQQSNIINKLISYSANSGTSGFIADKKNIFISTYGDGIFRMNQQTENIDTMNQSSILKAHLIIEFLIPLQSSFAALTYNSGLTIYDSSGGYKNLSRSEGLISNTVYTAYQDGENNIWIGSQNGLSVFDGRRVIKTYTSVNGLTGTKVLCIFRDAEQRFWVLSEKYLHLLENDRLRAIRSHPFLFDEKSSINRATFNSTTNTLFIGLTDALLTVDMNKVIPDENVDDPVLHVIKNDSVILFPGNNNHITLSPKASKINFQFLSRHYSITRRPEIYYRLRGFDDDWKQLVENGEVNYPKLPPGKYELIAKSINPDGYESSEKNLIKLEVFPPLWKRTWFIVLTAVFFLCLFFYIGNLISKRRYKYKLLNLQEKYRLQLERERIARELHDNVGSQLTYLINKIDDDYVHLAEKKEAENLSGFARGAMRELRETIWALDKKEVKWEDLENKIRQLVHLYKNEKHSVELNWKLNGAEESTINPVQALNIYRIVQEALNNAEKYSQASVVSIAANVQDKKIVIEVSDNGKGFDRLKSDTGYGFKSMKKRAEEMNANIIIESETGKGTKIKLELS